MRHYRSLPLGEALHVNAQSVRRSDYSVCFCESRTLSTEKQEAYKRLTLMCLFRTVSDRRRELLSGRQAEETRVLVVLPTGEGRLAGRRSAHWHGVYL